MNKIKIAIILIFIFIIPSVEAQQQSTDRIYIAFAFETITVSTSAVRFTAATIAPSSNTAFRAELAEYSLEGCSIRYRIGSTNPTSTVGTLLTTGSGRMYGWDNINNIHFIRDTSCSSDATMSVHYYR